MNEIAQKIGQYKFFTYMNMKLAYQQIANLRLYQFKRLPFGLTNAVPGFQRTMDQLISRNELCDTFAFFDDIIVRGSNEAELDQNLDKCENITRTLKMTLNFEKCKLKQTTISYLGYQMTFGTYKQILIGSIFDENACFFISQRASARYWHIFILFKMDTKLFTNRTAPACF